MIDKMIVSIGTGPAGLTAALELLRGARCRVIVLEASGDLKGILNQPRTWREKNRETPPWIWPTEGDHP